MSTRGADRIEGYDLARAVAIAFMVLINFQYYLLVRPSGDAGEVIGRWIFDLPSGRSSSLFVTLAGCGVALMARRARETGDAAELWRVRRTLLVRALVLLVAGNLLRLVWRIDILHYYAFYLALSCVWLRWRARWRLALAALIVVVTGAGAALIDERSLRGLEYWTPAGMAADVFLSGVHPVLPWIAFVLVGLCIGELDLRAPAARRRLLIVGASAAVLAELAAMMVTRLAITEVVLLPSEVVRVLGTSWSPDALFVVSTAGTAACAISVCHSVAARYGARGPVRALVATGQLSLSIYVLHALVGVGVPAWLFDREDALDLWTVVGYWAAFTLVVVAGAHFYRRRFARGPLEALMRWIAGAPKGERPPRAEEARVEMQVRPLGVAPWALGAGAVVVGSVPFLGVLEPTLGCGPPPPPLRLGERAVVELTLTCPHRELALELDAPARVAVSTTSAMDPWLVLFRGDEVQAEDDDSGPSVDARIEADVDPAARPRVRVRPYATSTGPVMVRVERAEAPEARAE